MPDINPAAALTPSIKAKALAAPGELIDRNLVARALDRDGDGVISRDEFSAAGLERLEADALETINRGGQRGNDVTVEELASALGSDRVRLTGEGNVSLTGGVARFSAGRLESGTPWAFPYVQGLNTLEQVKRIAPSGWSGYNPDSPSSEFTYTDYYKDTLTGARVKYQEGMQLRDNMFLSDPDSNGDRWVKIREVRYDDLANVLRSKAETIRDLTSGAKDPEIRQINSEVNRILMNSYWLSGNRRDRARDLYNALVAFDNINVPERPETRLTRLDSSLKTAASRVEEQARISRDIPVDRARAAVQKEADKLNSPANPLKLGIGVGGAAAAGAIAFFAAHLALPLVGGIALGGLALGYGIGWLINSSRAKGLNSDLEVLRSINPEGNKKALQQNAVVGYKILQDARTADTLASLRAFTETADKATSVVNTMTTKVANETRSLQNMESLVRKYAG